MLKLYKVLDLAKEAGISVVISHDKNYYYCSGRVYGEDLVNFARVVQNYLEQDVST